MSPPTIFNLTIFIIFSAYFFINRKKAVEAVKLSAKSFKRIFPLLLVILFVILILERILSFELIASSITSFSGWQGYLLSVFLGSIVQIPHFIAFSVAGQLLQGGVYPGFIAALVTSLVMVHTFSIPIEIKELGFKFAVIRNLISLIFAVIIGVIIGVLY
ncbi:hypothetical protein D6745_03490 [Candidatus Woesearchaeota archaeon]|nr:MAG: hypothetical protein D6745_03490 [Candidatus Woesearchaeota archaeon]